MRYVSKFIEESLAKRAVFIGGPLQVGKTTLALSFLSHDATASHAVLSRYLQELQEI